MTLKQKPAARLYPRFLLAGQRVLLDLGYAIDVARRRRRIQVALAAERCRMSPTTWKKIVKGDPGVAMGHYLSALQVVGLLDVMRHLADTSADTQGLLLDEENLVKRVRHRRTKGEHRE